MTLTVELPWPPRQVWPNFRQSNHWRKYHKQIAGQRQSAWALTLIAMRVAVFVIDHLNPIAMQVEFYPPDKRSRDDDGMIGAFKSARDGIADALKVDDKMFRPTYSYHEPEKPGRIVVTIG